LFAHCTNSVVLVTPAPSLYPSHLVNLLSLLSRLPGETIFGTVTGADTRAV
jgi:hypothetical protein